MVICKYTECTKEAVFGFHKDRVRRFCSEHREKGHINLSKKLCEFDSCTEYANYSDPKIGKLRFCKTHAPPEYVTKKKKLCEKCDTRASYGDPIEKVVRFCVTHKPDNFIKVHAKLCEKCEEKRASYGDPKENKLRFCKKCSPDNYIIIHKKNCEKCDVKACFGFPKENKPRFCKTHAPIGCFDLINKKCQKEGCIKQPSMGIPSTKTGLFCSEHAPDGFINVVDKRCDEPGCDIKPTCAKSGSKLKYCKRHAPEGFVAKIKTCEFEGCTKSPSFSEPSDKITGRWCVEHKTDTAVHRRYKKKCSNKDCGEIPTYGNIDENPSTCKIHAKKSYIDLVEYNKCNNHECDLQYDYITTDGNKFCSKHFPVDISEIEKLCHICNISSKSSYICRKCSTVRNKKEWSVVKYIQKNVKVPFLHDSKLYGGCYRRRPDLHFEGMKHDVIVEVDEKQHNHITPECEMVRMNEIFNDIGGKSIIYIRYNPDTFRHNNKIVKVNKEKRLELLVNTLKEELSKDYDKLFVGQIKLFFDINGEYSEKITSDLTSSLVI